MAIVEMKRITLLALRQDQRKIMRTMQRLGCVEISSFSAEEAETWKQADSGRLASVEETMKRLDELIPKASHYNAQKSPMFGFKPAADESLVGRIRTDEAQLKVDFLDKADELEKRGNDLTGRKARIAASREQLQPWLGLDIPVEDIASERELFQQAGTLEKAAVPALEAKWADKPVCIEVINEVRESAYVWVAAHRAVRDELLSDLKTASWSPANFGETKGTVRERDEAFQAELNGIAESEEALTKEWQALSENLTLFKTWYDLLRIERDELTAGARTIGTDSVFYLKGWVPAAQADAVAEKLQAVSPTCTVELEDPSEGETPPVRLQNDSFASPFESIVEGFALPAPGSVDPTAVMAPFYAMLFGMMLSDAGYGLVMAIAIPVLIKKMHPGVSSRKLLKILFWSALATVLCGFVYDTWFGFNPMKDLLHMQPILDPISKPMPVMIVCMGFGVIHLFAGLCVGAYRNIRDGKPQDAVFDQLSWMLAVSGAIMLVAGGTVAVIGKWMALTGVALILLFAGREKKNPFKRLISGLGALYGATSWISDILSYMRLFGMGLATGVIGMVINMLVGMVFAHGIIGKIIGAVLFVGAHAFNLGINALGAYVHSCRLQYIEFFGKFYEEGGVPFRPLENSTKYYTITDPGSETANS